MPEEKNDNPHKGDVAFLADRLALALLLHRDLMRGILLLPSREDDRADLREEPEYGRVKTTVREVLKRDREKRG